MRKWIHFFIALCLFWAAPLTTRANAYNPVLEWNAAALELVRLENIPPPYAARNLAIVHAAMFDAVNAVEQRYEPYRVHFVVQEEVSAEAAAVGAAHYTLTQLHPDQKIYLDTQYGESLQRLGSSEKVRTGIALGEEAAKHILAWREQDNSAGKVVYEPRQELGYWQPTAPGFKPALSPHWSQVTPFAIPGADAFRPAGPAAISTAEYVRQLEEVKQLGGKNSTQRTQDQTEIAEFWEDGPGTFTPPGHWNVITADLAHTHQVSLVDSARLFTLLNIAMADAGIACWDSKYHFDYWRPMQAIHQADEDGNSATQSDQAWEPLIYTPPFPEYVSGHSSFSGAAEAVLSSHFGPNTPFTAYAIGFESVQRQFPNFRAAAEEAGRSRIYGGIHFSSSNQDGLTLGRAVGQHVVQNHLKPVPAAASQPVAVTAPTGMQLPVWVLPAFIVTGIYLLRRTYFNSI